MPIAVLAVFAVIWTGLASGSAASRSATFDEPLHLVSGYAALAGGDFRLDPSHPPLVRMWAALPLAWKGLPPPATDAIDGQSGRDWLASPEETRLARRYLYSAADADRELARARFMIMLLAIGLGVLVFFWTFEHAGLRAGVLALALYGLSPNTLAHGALVTTDLGGTAFMFGAIYFLWRLVRRWSVASVVGLALMVPAAILAKYSGLMVLPVLGVLIVVAVWNRTALTARAALGLVAIVAVSTVVAIWAAYGFRYTPSASTAWVFRLQDAPELARNAPGAASLVNWLDSLKLLPNAFSQGLFYCVASSAQRAYLLGQLSSDGWWYYFPIAFLVKTPLALLILGAGGVFLLIRRFRDVGLVNVLFVAVPVVLFGTMAIASGINLGIRHLLPIYPFIFVVAGIAADWWLASPIRIAKPAMAALVLIWVLDVATVYPRTLTYFNLAAGGPKNGLAYLSDSNLDWGQHLSGLKTWMDNTGVAHVNLAYFGQADPAYYKINCTYLPSVPWIMRRVTARPTVPGFVAISATVQSGVYLPPEWRLFYEGFRTRTPVANIGNTIRVYWVDAWPEATEPARDPEVAALGTELALADGLLQTLHWPDKAARHYRRYLRERPNDVKAREGLAQALLASGNIASGLTALREAVALDSRDTSSRVNLILALLDHGGAEEAVPHAAAMSELAPDHAASWRLYGRALELSGRPRDAAAKFARAVELDPDSADARADLARVQKLQR